MINLLFSESIVPDANNVEQLTQQEETKDEENELEISLTISNELETMFAENSENTTVETEKTEEVGKMDEEPPESELGKLSYLESRC